MGTAEQELFNLWWQVDIELRYSTADILRVQSVIDPFAPAELASIRGVQGVLFEESRDSVLRYDVAEFRRILSDMPLATLVWGAFYFCTRKQHERMPVAWREPNPVALTKCNYEIRCVEQYHLQVYTRSEAAKRLLENEYKVVYTLRDVPSRLSFGEG